MPELWRGKDQFTVLEAGFGLGLNFLATWAAWEADPQRSSSLRFVSIEAYPVAAADIIRNALSSNPAIEADSELFGHVQVLVRELAQAWKDLSPGLQRFEFAGGRVQLALAVGDEYCRC